MSERFYLNSPLGVGLVELTGPEAHHLAVVCRLGPGDPLCLFNGDGHQYPARILAIAKRKVIVEVLGRESPQRELAFSLEIAAPMPKGDRTQILIEKLTELGVTRFVPLVCAHGVMQPRLGKLNKLHRYVLEASKQCGRNLLMEVDEPARWQDYCRRGSAGDLRLLAHPGQGQVAPPPQWTFSEKAKVIIAVGPEGGFTEEEIQLAYSAGWQTINLGPRILRVETAALVLAALVGNPQAAASAPSTPSDHRFYLQ